MARKIDAEIEQQIFEDLKQGELSYSAIAKKYGIGKGTISRIKNRKDNKLEIERPNKQTIGHRRKLREAKIQQEIVKRAPIVVSTMIDVLSGIRYSIDNLIEINEDSKTETEKIVEELEKLNDNVDKHIHSIDVNDKGIDVGKQKLINEIYKAIANAGNFYARETVRIKAITELRGQLETFAKYEVMLKGLTHIREFIDSLFKAMNILPDEHYKNYRNRVIDIYPAGKDYFEHYEAEVDEDSEHNNR